MSKITCKDLVLYINVIIVESFFVRTYQRTFNSLDAQSAMNAKDWKHHYPQRTKSEQQSYLLLRIRESEGV